MSKITYDAKQIQVLKGLEGVRKRPAMYIGDTGDGTGLHHLVYEVVDNAVDEALAGHCDEIKVTLQSDGSVSVSDNGRGIPVDVHAEEGISAAEVIMTRLHAGAKFDNASYKVAGGLHGVGVSVVNALSSWLKLKIFRGRHLYFCEFKKGETVKPIAAIDKAPRGKTGTEVSFLPDRTIFPDQRIDYMRIRHRLDELAYLNPGLRIRIEDLRSSPFRQEEFLHRGGLHELVKELLPKPLLRTPISISGVRDDVVVEGVIGWNDGYGETVRSYTNNIPQPDGGTHLTGMRAGLTRSVQKIVKDHGRRGLTVTADDIREGLVLVLSVKMHDPKFSSQTKDKLVSSEIRTIVEGIVVEAATEWLTKHPRDARSVTEKALKSASVREATRKARDLARKKNEIESKSLMPHRLADCQIKDSARREILLVEGESAGGSARQARNKEFQAVLPLKGKILNVEKATMSKLLANQEVCSLIAALGSGVGTDFDVKKLRYHKVIIMTDADVDGSHIRTLLLTFFYRHVPELLRRGHVYIAQSPLYRVRKKGEDVYLLDEDALRDYLRKHPNAQFQRFKGLGEMNPEQLWKTTLDPKTRNLIQVDIEDVEEAEEYFSLLMGDAVEPRRDFIYANALEVENLDV